MLKKTHIKCLEVFLKNNVNRPEKIFYRIR